LKLTALLKVAE